MERRDKLSHQYEVFAVKEDCAVIKFISERFADYRPNDGDGYYEFTQPEFVSPTKEVMLLHKVNFTSYNYITHSY